MELHVRHLRILCAIARAGSLNRAAVELRVAQPALSHQLRRIEQVVGCELFERDRRGVRPTRVGMLVLARAEAIVPAFDELERDFRPREHEPAGRLRVGWNDSAMTAALVGCLRRALPGVSVSTRADMSRTRLLSQVARRSIDLALVMMCGDRTQTVPDELEARVLVREPAFVALPATHRLADRSHVDLADLADEDWIVSSCGEGCRVVFREMCLAHGFTPRITHDVDTARDELVLGGLGVTLVQPTRPARPGLVVRPLVGDPMTVQHILLWRKDSPVSHLASGRLPRALLTAYELMAEKNDHYRRWLDERRMAQAVQPFLPPDTGVNKRTA
ncbi:LysR family transcriptional regulator [Streptoalloteichus hindustanus]|uniref:DNA-binding transcriptional regulator, LysR family n=1 Tax=Streptoalloteichus hindustanus TaxID=2017 RepID=A0A1M5MRF3_STRHI|nr:LysR family transcriptional regulator [Streptoalloteichus hindustanus]SHG79964.1 DNA-binding transcriptional regulator, LysR family [Streptoalloteichus hindustanus]